MKKQEIDPVLSYIGLDSPPTENHGRLEYLIKEKLEADGVGFAMALVHISRDKYGIRATYEVRNYYNEGMTQRWMQGWAKGGALIYEIGSSRQEAMYRFVLAMLKVRRSQNSSPWERQHHINPLTEKKVVPYVYGGMPKGTVTNMAETNTETNEFVSVGLHLAPWGQQVSIPEWKRALTLCRASKGALANFGPGGLSGVPKSWLPSARRTVTLLRASGFPEAALTLSKHRNIHHPQYEPGYGEFLGELAMQCETCGRDSPTTYPRRDNGFDGVVACDRCVREAPMVA